MDEATGNHVLSGQNQIQPQEIQLALVWTPDHFSETQPCMVPGAEQFIPTTEQVNSCCGPWLPPGLAGTELLVSIAWNEPAYSQEQRENQQLLWTYWCVCGLLFNSSNKQDRLRVGWCEVLSHTLSVPTPAPTRFQIDMKKTEKP